MYHISQHCQKSLSFVIEYDAHKLLLNMVCRGPGISVVGVIDHSFRQRTGFTWPEFREHYAPQSLRQLTMHQFLVHANAPPHVLEGQNENIRQLVDAYRHQGVLVVFQRRMGVTYNAFRQQHHLPQNLTV